MRLSSPDTGVSATVAAVRPAARKPAGTPGRVQTLLPVRVVARGNTSQSVYELLRRAIVNCEMAPGLAISEVEMAKRLQVSRTPVRESFRRLAGEGLLNVLPQVGTVVSKLSRAELMDALFIRESIECAAAQLAILAPLKERKALHKVMLQQRAAVARGDVEGGLTKDEDLHRGLIDLSGHPRAWEPVRQARAHLERVRRFGIPALQSNVKASDQHERITTALVTGDANALVLELRAHIRQIQGFVDGIAEQHPDFFSL